jgi:hypothetical protein
VLTAKETLEDEWLVYRWLDWLLRTQGQMFLYIPKSPKLRNTMEVIDKRLKID